MKGIAKSIAATFLLGLVVLIFGAIVLTIAMAIPYLAFKAIEYGMSKNIYVTVSLIIFCAALFLGFLLNGAEE